MPKSMFAESIAFAEQALNIITSRPEYSIVQIGAHTGNNANDCLHRSILRKHRGKSRENEAGTVVLIEPVPEFFEELKKTYNGIPGVYFENIAISDENHVSSFFYLPFDASEYEYPSWLNQLGSLSEEMLLRNNDGNPYDWHDFYLRNRVEIKVQCRTLNYILSKYDIGRLDALIIDAEGYDGRILSTMSFEAIKPSYIQFESSLLSPEEKDIIVLSLRCHGYDVRDTGFDTIACVPGLIAG